LSSRSGTSSKQRNKQQQRRPQQGQQTQPPKPKPTAAEAQALASQEAARREGRMQRQAQARAEAERRQRARKMRTYSIVGLVVVAIVAVAAWLILREAGKPGQAVDVMGVRNHVQPGEVHVPYSTDPPTSGPHVGDVPQFVVYTQPITQELQVHGLEDGGVVVNYRPDLDKPTVDKLASLVKLYEDTPGKQRVLMSPYPGLTNAIVLTSWGRMERLDAFDEVKIRAYIDAFVNIDHHETSEGQRLP
jgi:Protein of unknown function (DUF3105)